MVLAGLIRLEGVEYYFAWKNLKKSNTYVLFSRVHAQDLAKYELTNEHAYPLITSAELLRNYTNQDYVMEIIEELKVSGRMKKYSRFNTSLLNKVLTELSFARTYSFSPENVYKDENTFAGGKLLKDFNAKDKNLTYTFEKSGDEFQSITIEHNDFKMRLTTNLASLSLKDFKMQEVDNYQKKEISTLTLDAVSFDKLCNMLDMSWFWDSNTGKMKKHYEVIQTITDFEYKIMYQLYRELEMCKKNGTKLNISVDTETTGLNIYNLSENNEDRDHCVAIPISWKPDTAYVIFTDMEYFSNVPNQYAIDRLAQLFENFKGERTITIYEPPKDYWSENKVVTLQDVINASTTSTGMRYLAQDSNTAKESPEESNTAKESPEDSNAVKGSQTTQTQVKQMSFFGNTKVVNQKDLHQDSTNDFIDYAGSAELSDFTDNFGLTDNLNSFGEQSIKTTDDLTTTNALFHSINEQTQGETTLAQLYAYASKKSGTSDDLAKTSKQIKFTFTRELVNLIGHNIMFDRRVFYMFGKSFYFNEDTLQMAFDLNPKTVRGSVALKGLTHRLLGHETPELSDILGKGNEDKYRYLYDILVAMVYGCADADYTLTIYHILRKLMTSRMYKEYKRQDVQMLNILSISEYYGMQTIEKDVIALAKESEENLKILKDFMYSYVGTYVDYVNQREHLAILLQSGKLTQEQYESAIDNIKVSKDAKYEFEVKASEIRHVMYDILGYKIFAWTEGAKKLPKTDKYVMKKLASQKRNKDSHTFGTMTEDLLVYGADRNKYNEYLAKGFKYKAADMCLIKADDFNKCRNPLAIVLTKYAELNKEYTSYFKPIRETNMEGKIFKNYSLARIETRRIMNPGQTMKGKLKALIRSYTDDYYLLDFDMSQVEYRIMISLAKYVDMIRVMNNPERDYHTETASLLHGIPAHLVSKKIRKSTKCFNFGIPYGLSDRSLCDNLFGKIDDANMFATRELLQKWLKSNKPVSDMLEQYREDALVEQNISDDFRNYIDAWKKDELGQYELNVKGERIPTPIGMSINEKGFYRIYDLQDLDKAKIGSIRRAAGNYPIQSFAAEVFRIILTRFYNRCEEEGINDKIIWHMLIHDELLCSVHKSLHPFYIYKLVKESCMITMPGHTKYFVGINIGDTWAQCKDDSREAPVIFVERMIKKWDNGDFGKGPFWFDDPWGFIKPYRDQYVQDRILEIIQRLQPNVMESPIDVPKLLATFSNYTVRSYVDDYDMNYKITKKYDPDDPDEQIQKSNDEWASRLETWALNVFGDGKQMIDIDGNLKILHKKGSALQSEIKDDSDLAQTTIVDNSLPDGLGMVASQEETHASSTDSNAILQNLGELIFDEDDNDDDARDITPGLLFDDDFNQDDSYWEFDDNDLRVSYDNYGEDDEVEEEDGIQFIDTKNADSVAACIKIEKPMQNITMLNQQAIIESKHYKVTQKCKNYLQPYLSKSGIRIVFHEPNGLKRWQTVKQKTDLKKLDKWLTKANALIESMVKK